jgi:hypothetical protein
MVLPPFDVGPIQDRLTCAFPGVAEFKVGALGTVRGVALSAFEAGPVPAALVAVTLKEYEVPFVSPMTLQSVAPLVVHVAPPGLAVAV